MAKLAKCVCGKRAGQTSRADSGAPRMWTADVWCKYGLCNTFLRAEAKTKHAAQRMARAGWNAMMGAADE